MARRVLFVHPSATMYGADRQLHALATGLDPARYRPVIVLGERGELGGLLEHAGVETHYAPLPVLRRSLLTGRGVPATAIRLARSRHRLVHLARERGVAIVHTNTSIVLGGAAIAAGAGAAHVMHVREIYAGAGGRAGPVLWPLLRRRLLHADAVACVSAAAAAQLGPSSRTFVLHDGIARVPDPVPRDAARTALGLPPDRFVVAAVGRLSDWKGHDVLARALAEPPLSEIGAIVLVAGDAAPGQERHASDLDRLCAELGLGDRVRMLGFKRDVATVLGAADAAAVPSTHPEAFPNAALEAAAAAKPVVATAHGGALEIVRDGATGRLVSPRDHRALAAALRALADAPDAARRLGKAAAADVRGRFGLARMLDDVQARYDRLR